MARPLRERDRVVFTSAAGTGLENKTGTIITSAGTRFQGESGEFRQDSGNFQGDGIPMWVVRLDITYKEGVYPENHLKLKE